jgi:hypothetical protein
MEEPNNLVSWIVVGVSLGALFLGCALVIKKFFVDKKYFGGSEFVGRQIYKEFQNADSRDNIEHVIYMEEDESCQDFTAADNDEDEQKSTL